MNVYEGIKKWADYFTSKSKKSPMPVPIKETNDEFISFDSSELEF